MNPNPYESPKECCQSKPGPFKVGFNFGLNVLLLILGVIVGIVGSIVKVVFSRTVLETVATYALVGLIVWPLWNFTATAALDYFNYIGYLQAVGLVILCRILFRPTVSAPKGETLSAQEKLLIDLMRNSGSLPVGSGASLDPARRAGSGPQRPVSATPAGKV